MSNPPSRAWIPRESSFADSDKPGGENESVDENPVAREAVDPQQQQQVNHSTRASDSRPKPQSVDRLSALAEWRISSAMRRLYPDDFFNTSPSLSQLQPSLLPPDAPSNADTTALQDSIDRVLAREIALLNTQIAAEERSSQIAQKELLSTNLETRRLQELQGIIGLVKLEEIHELFAEAKRIRNSCGALSAPAKSKTRVRDDPIENKPASDLSLELKKASYQRLLVEAASGRGVRRAQEKKNIFFLSSRLGELVEICSRLAVARCALQLEAESTEELRSEVESERLQQSTNKQKQILQKKKLDSTTEILEFLVRLESIEIGELARIVERKNIIAEIDKSIQSGNASLMGMLQL